MDDVLASWISVITLAKGRLLALGDGLGAELAVEPTAAGCAQIVDRAIYAALHELSEARRQAADELAAREPPAAAGVAP